MKRRICIYISLALLGLVIVGCSGAYTRGADGEVFENGRWTYKDNYSGDWRCEIESNGEWYGDFSGANGEPTGLRSLRGDGNAVVYLPDNIEIRVATVGQKDDSGPFSIRIVGPGHSGELVSGHDTTPITTTQGK